MLSKKIHKTGLINLEQQNIAVNDIISKFTDIGKQELINRLDLHPFELYILDYFYDGISCDKISN